MNSRTVIKQNLEKQNKDVFSQLGVKVDLLKKHPETIPEVTKWIYDEWRGYDVTLTQQKLVDAFKARLNNEHLPVTFVAIKNRSPVAVVTLKDKEDPELTALSKGNPWLGSLQVTPGERNKGLGSNLLGLVKSISEELGYNHIYLYTSNPTNVVWYEKNGAQLLEQRNFRNHQVSIMKF